jgi:hypothetical protein
MKGRRDTGVGSGVLLGLLVLLREHQKIETELRVVLETRMTDASRKDFLEYLDFVAAARGLVRESLQSCDQTIGEVRLIGELLRHGSK